MIEFIQLCFAPVNLLFTLMLFCVMGYWTMFFAGAVGLDFLDDVDVDMDADVDVDLDIDVNADIDVDADLEVDADVDPDLDHGHSGHMEVGKGVAISFMRFMHVGHVPLMVLLTAFIGSIWAVSIVSNYNFNPTLSATIGLALFIPNLLVSLLVTKVLTFPAAAVYKRTNSGVERRTKIIGRTCFVTTSNVTERSGQAEIRLDNAAPITLNVRCRSDVTKPLKKGDEALILELVEDKGTYIVVPFDLEVT